MRNNTVRAGNNDTASTCTEPFTVQGQATSIRNLINAKFMPGLPEQYIPFAPNWIIRGYIVKDNGTMKFDFKSLVGIDGYTMDVLHPEDD